MAYPVCVTSFTVSVMLPVGDGQMPTANTIHMQPYPQQPPPMQYGGGQQSPQQPQSSSGYQRFVPYGNVPPFSP